MGDLNKSHPTYLCPMHTDLVATHNQQPRPPRCHGADHVGGYGRCDDD